MEDLPPSHSELPDPQHLISAPEDRWWHYAGALALVLAIFALGVVGLQVAE